VNASHLAYAEMQGYLGLTLEELESLPTLAETQTADLKFEQNGCTERVWLERVGVDSGMPYDNMVTVEFLLEGGWETLTEYPAE
jgi:hypothetical protein